MIINDIDRSGLGETTNRQFLLDKQPILKTQQNILSKQEVFQIIRDKSLCVDVEVDDVIKHSLAFYYMKINMIRPDNPFIVCWNILHLCIIIFYLLEFPLIVGFGEVVWKDVAYTLLPLMIINYLILIADILITPLKMCYKEGQLIKDRKVLLKDYLKMNFWIDIIGLLSIVIPVMLRDYFQVNVIKFLFFPKIVILNELNGKILGVLIFRVKAKTIYLIGRLVVFIIMIAHYIGIGFYMVGYWVYKTNYYGPNTPNICWLYNAQAYSQIVLLLDWKGQYLYSMYFSLGVTTTIAYGDITPLNPIETLYMVFALVINTLAFGYILSQILRVLIEAFYTEFEKNNIRYIMESILVSRKIKPKLRQLIRAHMQQIAKQQMYRDRKIQRQIIGSLPFNLQIDLCTKIYGEFMQSLKISPQPFYTDKNRNTRFIQKLLLEITESRYLVGDLIYKQNQIFTEQFNNHKTYFLKDTSQVNDIILGVGKSPNINLQTHQVQDEFEHMIFRNDRSFFGQVQFLTGMHRSHWVMSKNNILLYEMPRNAFLKNLRFASRKQLQYLTEYKQKIQNSYCYICHGEHIFKKCTKTTFTPDLLTSIKKINENQRMKRKHNSQTQDMRTQKRNVSAKTNALKLFKQSKDSKNKKALEKSKIRLLANSKHYRRVYHQDTSSQYSSVSSSDSSQDLDFFINQTKILIQSLNKVGNSNQRQEQDRPFFDYDFDGYYHFQGYKPSANYQQVLSKLKDLQRIMQSKKKISMKMVRNFRRMQ